jgi:hypothetical protein
MPQVIWPTAKSLTMRDGPKAQSEIHGSLGPIFYPTDKANIIAYRPSSGHMAFATVTTGDMWRLKSKPCSLSAMKTTLLISDPATSQKKGCP